MRQLVWVPVTLAALVALALLLRPDLFPALLSLDVSFLAQAHVAATFCRIGTMSLSVHQKRFLAVDLLLAAIGVSVGVGYCVSIQALATTYMIWQTYHYSRQSYGIDRILRRSLGDAPNRDVSVLLFSSAAGAFLLAVSRNGGHFLGLPVYSLPDEIAAMGGRLIIAISLGCLVIRALPNWRMTSRLVTVYGWSHIAIFIGSCALFPSLEHAWLVTNVWHNSQYLLIVRNSIVTSPVAVNTGVGTVLSSWFGVPILVACCLIGLLAYALLGGAVRHGILVTGMAAGPFLVGVYMSVNFHHYLVDSIVWKRSSRVLRAIG